MSTRAPRIWHIEERNGYFYPTNQFGGFTRCNYLADAEAHVRIDVETYGDTYHTPHCAGPGVCDGCGYLDAAGEWHGGPCPVELVASQAILAEGLS